MYRYHEIFPRMHTYIHTYIHTYTYIHSYIHAYIHTYINECICTYVYIHTYIHNIHIYILRDTHINTYMRACVVHTHNFLDYGIVCRKIKIFLESKIMPLHNPNRPCNSMLNVISSMDTKGVSHIYKLLTGRNSSITEKACYKWNEKLTSKGEILSVKKSFFPKKDVW